jgi:hypothetical protein
MIPSRPQTPTAAGDFSGRDLVNAVETRSARDGSTGFFANAHRVASQSSEARAQMFLPSVCGDPLPLL